MTPFSGPRGVEFVNLQQRYAVRIASLRKFVRDLKKRLRLKTRQFNVCFVDDPAMRRLNQAYRGKNQATDVLSFGWNEGVDRRDVRAADLRAGKSRARFLGEIVISVETARRNAKLEGHATLNEIRWLILHGLLHLLGHDHETDTGEMNALELDLREKLGVAGGARLARRR
jgi:probable rRNA maturation factor